MKKNYTALYLAYPYSKMTKSKFKTIKAAEAYITLRNAIHSLKRSEWLVINTNVLHKHLDVLEQSFIEKGENAILC